MIYFIIAVVLLLAVGFIVNVQQGHSDGWYSTVTLALIIWGVWLIAVNWSTL